MAASISITHLIVRLDTGGAEKSLFRLIRATGEQLDHRVICLEPDSQIAADIARLGVDVACLDYPRAGPLALWRALRLLRRQPPQVLQGWVYLGNLVAALFALVLPGSMRVGWNVRSSIGRLSDEKFATRASVRLGGWCCRLSATRSDLIIYNSHAGQHSHKVFGFNGGYPVVIYNGIDTDEFAPNHANRMAVRGRFGFETGEDDAILVGLVARYHRVKGVNEFVRAAARLCAVRARDWHFALVGGGMSEDNEELMGYIHDSGIPRERIKLVGEISDTPAFLPGLDLLVVASLREGTPNALLEAMACGVNVVGTDVGDVAAIVNDRQRVAAPGDVADLVRKIDNAVAADHLELTARVQAGRAFVAEHYATEQCMAAYVHSYELLMQAR